MPKANSIDRIAKNIKDRVKKHEHSDNQFRLNFNKIQAL
jgi:hypothetical protein